MAMPFKPGLEKLTEGRTEQKAWEVKVVFIRERTGRGDPVVRWGGRRFGFQYFQTLPGDTVQMVGSFRHDPLVCISCSGCPSGPLWPETHRRNWEIRFDNWSKVQVSRVKLEDVYDSPSYSGDGSSHNTGHLKQRTGSQFTQTEPDKLLFIEDQNTLRFLWKARKDFPGGAGKGEHKCQQHCL